MRHYIFRVVLAVGFIFLLSGCEKKQVVIHNNFPGFIIADKDIYNNFTFTGVAQKRNVNDLLEIEAEFENMTDRMQRISYKVEWKDSSGFTIKTIMSRMISADVGAFRRLRISAVAPSPKATTYNIRLLTQNAYERNITSPYKHIIQDQ